jgi:hypothetical protein
MTSGRLAAVFVLGWLGAGCFNPQFNPGAYKCGVGHPCPSNFHCATDGLCYPPDAGPEAPPKPVCTSETPGPTCPHPPALGLACNPTCGTGCSCGWCGLNTEGQVACLMGTPGTKTVPGTVCDLTIPNDCAPGLVCRAECGSARCYKFCETSDDCPGTTCSMSVGSVHLCSLPDPGCDPVKQTGCPPKFACYPPSKSTTECDCPGTAGSGVGCMFLNECLPGYECVSLTGAPKDATCQQLCRTSSDCGGGTCAPSGTTYGYCTP